MMADTERPAAAQMGADSRHRAREVALQMLYQWEVGRAPIDEVCQTFWTNGPAGAPPPESVRSFATLLATGVAAHAARLDPLIAEAAEHWRIERMNVMDRLILRLAVYEFLKQPETPSKVIINEGIELAKRYGTVDSFKFVNAVLDKSARELRRAASGNAG